MAKRVNDTTSMPQNAKGLLEDYANGLIRQYKQSKGIVTDDQQRIWVIYARKSTKGKKKDSDGEVVERQEKSVQEQLAACHSYANKNKIKILTEFVDDGISARKSGKRDDFAKMLRWIKQGKCNSILAWHPDRLARNMKEAGEIIDMIDRGEIFDLAFCTHTFIRDNNGVMTLGFQFILAKQYSDNLSAVSTRGSESKASEGIVPNRKARRGYTLNKQHQFVPDGNNFTILQKGFQMALDGTSLDDIARYMMQAGFTYKGKKINLDRRILSPIFSDPFYAGLYVYGKVKVWLRDVYPQSHPYKPVIEPADFMRLRNCLAHNQPNFIKKTGNRNLPYKNLVICGSCNSTMTPEVSTGNTTRTFRVSCKNEDCLGKTLKLLRSIRSYQLTDFMGEKLLKGVEVSEAAYNDYLYEMSKDLTRKSDGLRERYRLLLANLRRKKCSLDEMVEKGLPNAKTPVVLDKLNEQIEKNDDKIKKLESETEELQKVIADTDYALSHQVMSYETFSNYIKNIGHTIKNTENLAEIEKIAKMVFSNLVVEEGKVVSYSLNPNFERYLKPNCQLMSGKEDSNLRPYGPKPYALAI